MPNSVEGSDALDYAAYGTVHMTPVLNCCREAVDIATCRALPVVLVRMNNREIVNFRTVVTQEVAAKIGSDVHLGTYRVVIHLWSPLKNTQLLSPGSAAAQCRFTRRDNRKRALE